MEQNDRNTDWGTVAIAVATIIISVFIFFTIYKAPKSTTQTSYTYTCVDKEKRLESSFTLNVFDKGTRTEYYIVFQDKHDNVYLMNVSQREYYTYKVGKEYTFDHALIKNLTN